ncbi:MAG: hypothetical protein LBC37_05355, partial [Zoogloeaceae bacterium]|nr:hypothetical protein [Zoogloeaceae bacterium]
QLAFTPLSAAGEHCRWLLIQDNPRAETAPPPDQPSAVLRPSALCRISQQKRAGKACPFLGKGEETHYPSARSRRGALRAPVGRHAAEWLRARAARPYENRSDCAGFALGLTV